MTTSLQCHSFLLPAVRQWVTMWQCESCYSQWSKVRFIERTSRMCAPPMARRRTGLGAQLTRLMLARRAACPLVQPTTTNTDPHQAGWERGVWGLREASREGGWVEASWSKDKLSPLVDDTVPAGQSSTHIPTNVLSLSAGPKDKQPPSYCIFFFPISDPSTSSHTIDLHFSNNTFLLPVNYKCLGLCKVCWLKMPNTQYQVCSPPNTNYAIPNAEYTLPNIKHSSIMSSVVFCKFTK